MKNKLFALLITVVLVMSMSGCNFAGAMSALLASPTPLPTSTPLATNTPTPTNTPVPTNTPIPTNTPLPRAGIDTPVYIGGVAVTFYHVLWSENPVVVGQNTLTPNSIGAAIVFYGTYPSGESQLLKNALSGSLQGSDAFYLIGSMGLHYDWTTAYVDNSGTVQIGWLLSKDDGLPYRVVDTYDGWNVDLSSLF